MIGTDPEYFTTKNRTLSLGTSFTDSDISTARKVVVLGSSAAEGIFGTTDAVGRPVLLDGIQFTSWGCCRPQATSPTATTPRSHR
ncbi:hypothetical protein FB470_003108 [Amycolatopsis thermophila]|uniref:MacB-like periplasmic core domain-containing protein n=1 Tax=Amycolatopsis thermophila TaxID=206084 RepID=A0ABU0EUX0_9PSEU|nr:ABC transporter permease [Amycolatopsis thermophila]MDQ0379114.1 hypothetical protein [Amycolatopsis thermophila]